MEDINIFCQNSRNGGSGYMNSNIFQKFMYFGSETLATWLRVIIRDLIPGPNSPLIPRDNSPEYVFWVVYVSY